MYTGVYIHIPFCRSKCLYCDFPSLAGCETLYQDYTAALCREITGRGGMFSHARVDTVYIGGGTPTLLSDKQLFSIVDSLNLHWHIEETAEFSIEANPGTVDLAKLMFLRSLGINRLSFGAQSFNDNILLSLGRSHSAREAAEAVNMAQQAGFNNINVDLMYGLPGQAMTDWEDTIRTALRLGVRHISAYGLKVEEGTPFFMRQQQGLLALPTEETEETMYDFVAEYLPQQGFCRYEISNYALPGYECRHNLKYWHYQPYAGLGAGAHSFSDGRRIANTAVIGDYIRNASQGGMPSVAEECISNDDAMAEFIFLALRTTGGVSLLEFVSRFGVDFKQRYSREISRLAREGMLELSRDRAFLTSRGMKFGNVAFAAFLPDQT